MSYYDQIDPLESLRLIPTGADRANRAKELLTIGGPIFLSSNDPGILLNQIDQELSQGKILLVGLDLTQYTSNWLLFIPEIPSSRQSTPRISRIMITPQITNIIDLGPNSEERYTKEDFLKLISDVLHQKVYDPWTLLRGEHSVDLWSYQSKR